MDIVYRVHRANDSTIPAEVDLNGEKVMATVKVFEVELTDDAGQHGTITWRFRTEAEIARAREVFVLGSDFTIPY